MNTHGIVLFVHILSAAVLVGSGLLLPAVRAAIRGARDLDGLRASVDILRRASQANPVAALVLLATGLWMGSAGWYGSAWFQVAFAVWVASAVLAIRVVKRGGMELGRAAAAAGSGPVPPSVDELRWSPTWELAAMSLMANDLAELFLMTNKPGLAGSIGAVVLLQAGVGLLHVARGRRRAALLGA